MLFEENTKDIEYDEMSVTADEVVLDLFEHIKNKQDLRKILDIPEVKALIEGGEIDDGEWELSKEIINKITEIGYSDTFDALLLQDATSEVVEDGGFVFQIEYGNGSWIHRICEYSGIFNRVPHTRISHH
jgi:hypothetical protein